MNRLSFLMSKLGGVATIALAAYGCSGDDSSPALPGEVHIEIAGTWVNEAFAETDVIDDASWSSESDFGSSVSSIVEFSNDDRYAVLHAPNDASAYYPDTFSRVVWTTPASGAFYYCTVIYGCATAALTKSGNVAPGADGGGAGGAGGAPGAGGAGDGGGFATCELSTVDDSDPEHGGCGAFPWTKLTAK